MHKINTEGHGLLFAKQNLKIYERHSMLRKILVMIKNNPACNYFS